MEGQDWVAGILWDTHDGRKAQSRLTERGNGAGEIEEELQNIRKWKE
jgi:hypothetical protein